MSYQYDKYLNDHVGGVYRAACWLETNLPDIWPDEITAKQIAADHDKSKRSEEEYDAYDDHFYGHQVAEERDIPFQYAWLHHVHNNPHHWQYWIYLDGRPLDMPVRYIFEMICDWWSFSWKSGNLNEIFDWWNDHAPFICLSDHTKQHVERILSEMAMKLEKEEKEASHD